jgi:hypothetical protein
MVFSVTYTICEWLKQHARDLKVSRPLIANTIPFVNVVTSFSERNIYIMAFIIAHWDTSNDSLAF